jgi:ribonuclease III
MIEHVPADLAELERRLGHRVLDPDLLTRALTHSSYANEHPPLPSNEALALIGDAALGLVVAEHVFGADPAAPVGVLTPRRAELVSGANLARWAADLGLGPLVRLGRGEDQTGGRTRESILATTLEALLGAIYLEAGIPAVRRVVATLAAWPEEPPRQ